MTDRRRNGLILLLVAGLFAVSAAVIALKPTKLGLELKGGVQLVYQAKPTAQSKVTAESLERSINIMRKRVDQLGVAQPEIQRSGGQEIDVALPDVSNAQRAEAEVGKTAQLYFYDWEPNVIGPTGKLASATETTVTGGPAAGSSAYGIPQYQAVLRAAKRAPILRKNATTLGGRVHPRAGRRVRVRRLVPDRHSPRKDAVRGRQGDLSAPGNRTEPVRRRLQAAGWAPSPRRCA